MKHLSEKEAWLVMAGMFITQPHESEDDVRLKHGLCSALEVINLRISDRTYAAIWAKIKRAVAKINKEFYHTEWLAERTIAGAKVRVDFAINASRRTRR